MLEHETLTLVKEMIGNEDILRERGGSRDVTGLTWLLANLNILDSVLAVDLWGLSCLRVVSPSLT